MESIRHKIHTIPPQVKASFWALFCGVLQKGIGVITTPIFTRLLSTAEYGQYNVFNSWIQIFTVIFSLNLCAGVYQQGLVKFDEDNRAYTSSMQGLTTVLMIIWGGILFIFRNKLTGLLSLNTRQIVMIPLIIWSASIFGFWLAEQRNFYKYKALVFVTLTVSVLSPALAILLIKISDDKVTARILGGLIIGLIAYVPLYCLHIKRGKKFFSAKYWRYALIFNIPLVPHYLSQVVLNSSDRIMIEKMVDKSAAGIYGLAYSISLIMTILNNALSQTLSPWIYQKIKARETERISSVAYISMIGVSAVNLILIALAPEAVKIFAPAEYYDAIWIIPPVAISVYYMFIYDMFAKFAFYYEKRIFITVASVAAAALNIILNYIFINKYGYIAAGYTTLICYIVYSLGHYIFMKRVCKKFCDGVQPYDGKIILLISFAFTACGLAMLLTYNHTVIRYCILAAIIIIAVLLRKKILEFIKNILIMRKSHDSGKAEIDER